MTADQVPITPSGIRAFMIELIDVAASHTLGHFRRTLAVDNKRSDGFDPVTEADRATETALRQAIAGRFPEHGIRGEEHSPRNPAARYQWVIDPIDGTKAYVCGVPTWASLVGLCDGVQPVCGMMSQPFVGEYFLGGFGEAVNVTRTGTTALHTRQHTALAQASLFATAPSMFSPDERRTFERLSARVRHTRFGIDSYAYCLLAGGYIDLVAEAGLGFYDIAALVPIIEAAGGIVTDWQGAAVRDGGRVLAAGNATLHAEALALLNV